MTEHELGERLRGGREHDRDDRRRDQREHDRPAHERVASGLIGVGEVEAQERLDHPEAHDDADEDDAVGEQLDLAVPGGVDVARVHRQQQDRDELRDDVRDLVGRQRGDQALQVLKHGG